MIDLKSNIWDQPATRELAQVLTTLDDRRLMQAFLRDVMTESEIIEISSRLQAATMLSNGAKYADITASTKLSSRTIARISDWMQNGTGGYAAALTIADHHAHTTRLGAA